MPTSRGTLVAAVAGQPGGGTVRVGQLELNLSIAKLYGAAKPFIDAEFGSPRADSRAALADLLAFLGRSVIGPVWQVLGQLGLTAEPVTILPFGMLSYMPIACAAPPADEPGSPMPLGRVRLAYSARHLVAAQQAEAKPSASALVVNNPRPLPVQYDPLLLADAEAALVASRFPARVLVGREATTEAVIDGFRGADLIHFTCHGTVSRDLGYTGTLLLARSEILAYRHLRSTDRLQAQLVVLAACRSGAAGVAVEHPLSLPAAFLAAGARAVVGSLWHAEDMATLLLMGEFYRRWQAAPADPAAALGAAQDWLRAATADTLRSAVPSTALSTSAGAVLREAPAFSLPYEHPWYWAGFFVAGWSQ